MTNAPSKQDNFRPYCLHLSDENPYETNLFESKATNK